MNRLVLVCRHSVITSAATHTRWWMAMSHGITPSGAPRILLTPSQPLRTMLDSSVCGMRQQRVWTSDVQLVKHAMINSYLEDTGNFIPVAAQRLPLNFLAALLVPSRELFQSVTGRCL